MTVDKINLLQDKLAFMILKQELKKCDGIAFRSIKDKEEFARGCYEMAQSMLYVRSDFVFTETAARLKNLKV